MKNLNKKTVTEVCQMIDTVLEKSRGSLSNEDFQLLKELQFSLRNLKHSTPHEVKLKLPMILELWVRVILRPEVMDKFHHWIKEIIDKF